MYLTYLNFTILPSRLKSKAQPPLSPPSHFFADEGKLEHDLRGKELTAHPLCQPVRGQVPFLDAERGDARADRIRATVSGGRV